MKKTAKRPLTDEEIMAYDNVPIDVAARYIGWSSPTIYRALREERAPFGLAVCSEETGTWTYNISPGARTGDPAYGAKLARLDREQYRHRRLARRRRAVLERLRKQKEAASC